MTQVIILAAGMGKRMGGEEPKVLKHLAGRPMISYLLDSVKESNLSKKPVVVIESEESPIKQQLDDECIYVIQRDRKGTGHAVKVSHQLVKRIPHDHVLVLYGDMPFISAVTMKELDIRHRLEDNMITMATVRIPNFEGEYQMFDDFGRVMRGESFSIVEIVEKKDATEEQRGITEVNPAIFCFNAPWLWSHIGKLENKNIQKEYYLTDLVKMAFDESAKIGSYQIRNPFEAIGINNPDHLEQAEKILEEMKHVHGNH